MVRKLAPCAFATFLLAAQPCFALVTEPNGLVVPLDSQNGEVQLYTLLQQQGETINWQQDAHTTPDVFSPLCSFTATFLLHEAGADLGVGWYNVDPAATQPPDLSQIHIVVPAGTPVGTQISSATIQGDPAYKGGLVGFALVGAQTHYSEQKWNVVCSNCANPGPWATSVTYKSSKIPDAYYLAFEDGNVNASGFGNDGDFNDDVFLFAGLVCAGGGQPCHTGSPGVCAVGVTECVSSGSTTCKQVYQPSPEKCDALDNDCNDKVDEGDLCEAKLVCVKGKCVPKCGGGEFTCPGGKVCSEGYCIDAACAKVNCPQGQVCVDGKCKDACDGVVCPGAQTCIAGVCLDPCKGVTCPAGQVCELGACVVGCDCAPCATGLACNTTSKHCVEPSCANSTCQPSEYCKNGSCGDACTGAVCPAGQTCTAGACVDIPTDGGTAGAGGSSKPEGGLFVEAGSVKDGSSVGGSAGHTQIGDPGGGSATGEEGGCGCRTAQHRTPSWFGMGVMALVSLLWRRQKKARGQ